MNIGFYGKGGSGKTTISSLFALYLDSKDHHVGLLDADVNSHTSDVIGIKSDLSKTLSTSKNEIDIWNYLAGKNLKVDPKEFLNTTPPGNGSGYWSMNKNNHLTKAYGQAFGVNAHLFTVGSYTEESIGVACHHTTQSIAENMVSHFMPEKEDVLVVDSVAGNDAFGTTLFLNDILVFVVKPEREGISVMNRFLQLSKSAGIEDKVLILGNQVGSDVQRHFLQREIPEEKLLGLLSVNNIVIDTRLEGKPLSIECLDSKAEAVFSKVYETAKSQKDHVSRYTRLLELHRKVAAEDWVSGSYRAGLVDQIDTAFSPS